MVDMAITTTQPKGIVGVPRDMNDLNTIIQISSVLVRSGFMPSHIRSEQQAAAIIMMGAEYGLSYWTSINNINVINGKPAASPQLMLAMINASGLLENIEFDCSDTVAIVTMKRSGRAAHTESFSMDDAQKLGLAAKENYKKQPKTMLKWRAVAACARVVFPDVILGLYTPDELGADVDVDAEGNMTVVGEVEEVRSTTPPLRALPKHGESATPAPDSAAGAASGNGGSAEIKHWITDDTAKQAFAAYWRKHEFTEKGKPKNVDWEAALKETGEMLGHPIKGFSELDLKTYPTVDSFLAAMDAHLQSLAANNKPKPKFTWDEQSIAHLDAWCQANFETPAELILISAPVSDVRGFASEEAARAGIIAEVVKRLLPVTARDVSYAGKGKPIVFHTVIGDLSYHAGRTKLREIFAEIDETGLQNLQDEGLKSKLSLDKLVLLTWEKRGEADRAYMEVVGVSLSMADIPF